MSLSAPPLLPSASAPTLENHVSRVTGALTASPAGGGTAGSAAGAAPAASNTVFLTSAIFSTDSQPRNR